VLDPYFFYRPLALMAPSVVVLLPALWWRRWPPWDATTRLCVLLVLLPAVALTFGPQRRPHYMLPAMAPLAILLARTALAVAERDGARWTLRALAVACVATGVVEVSLASTHLLWSQRRFAGAALARQAGTTLPANVPLVTLEKGAPAASYYAERRVQRVRSVRRLSRLVDAAPSGTLGLIVSAGRLATIPDTLGVTVLHRTFVDHTEQLVLVRLERAPRREPLAPPRDERRPPPA
jgi:4-amino-4-deoxy-L-arabinose transferase-like glycosyltransferase